MERSRRIVIVAHCILNASSRVEGVAGYQGVHPLVAELSRRGFGLIQIPCPELASEGLDRPRKTRDEYDTPAYRTHCSHIAEEIAREVGIYVDAGYEVSALVGVDGSPSCGVDTTSAACPEPPGSTRRVSGRGILIEELARRLAPYGLSFAAVDSHDSDLGVVRVLRVMEG